ncbi:MAG: HlyD family type I secretion periplasmic adaptor subunit [Planctomycetota bacterium]
MSTQRKYPRGEHIFREGESGGYAYVLNEGTVEIVKTSPTGPLVLHTVEHNALFGEMAVIDRGVRSASAYAATDVVVTEIDHEAFLTYIADHPKTALKLMGQLAGYVRSSNVKLGHADDRVAASADSAAKITPAPDDRQPITEVIEDTDAIYDRKPSRPIWITWMSLMVFVIIGIIFLSVTSVATTVSSRGKLSTKVPNVEVQATSSAVIEQLYVERGQSVAKGQTVVRLDGTFATADLTVVVEKLTANDQRIRRMTLEQELMVSGGKIPVSSGLNEINHNILSKRLDEYRSRVTSFESQIKSLDQEIVTARNTVEIASAQLQVKQQIEAAHKKMYDSKVGSQMTYLQSRDASLVALREHGNAKNSIDNLQVQKISTNADRQAFHAQWASTLAKELGQNQETKAELSEQRVKLDRQVSNLNVRSPVDGIVLDLPKVTAGSIVKEGETLFTLVRTNVPLELEIDIDPKDVSDLKLLASVSIKLDALPFQQYGDLKGELVFISDDTLAESLAGEPGAWYRGRVKILDAALNELPDGIDLTPGMLASADLLVGKRRLVTYFTYPITRNISQAFHEPD